MYPADTQYRFCPACAGTLVLTADPHDEPGAADPAAASAIDAAETPGNPDTPPSIPVADTDRPTSPGPPPKLQVDGDLGFVRLNDWSRTINVYLGLGDQAAAEDVVRGLASDSGQSLDNLHHLLQPDQTLRSAPRQLNLDEYVVPAADLDHVRTVFVPPPSFEDARATLARQRLLVLAGPPHSGRLTMALAVADGAPGGRPDAVPAIYLLPHDLVVSERQLFQARLLDQATFIVRDHGAQTASLAQTLLGQRRPPDVARVRTTLQQTHSRLILVCDPTSSLLTTAAVRDTLDAEGVLVEPGLPAAPDVLDRHLQQVLGAAKAANVRKLLNHHFGDVAQRLRTPARIAKFARLFARHLTQSPAEQAHELWPIAEETLHLVTNTRAEARSLFQSLPDDRHRYAALTLTLFDDVRLPDFWMVQQLILERSGLEVSTGDTPSPPDNDQVAARLSHFALSDADLIAAIGGKIVNATTESDLGPLPVKYVRFADAELHAALRQFLYEHYHARLIGLVPLLEELVRSGGPELRRAAARALGSIGALDFERLLLPTVDRWRRSDHAYLRAAAGHALDQALHDPACTPLTIQLLRGWSTTRASGGERWKSQWTAAAAWKVMGLDQPGLALTELKHLASHLHLARDRDAATMVFPALAYTLIVLSVQGHLAAVLHTLDDWMHDGEDSAHTLPLTATLLWIQLMGVFHDLARAARRQDPTATPLHEVVRLLLQPSADAGSPAAGPPLTIEVAANLVSQGFVQMYGVLEGGQRQHAVVLDVVRQWIEDSPPTDEVLATLQAVLDQTLQRLDAHKNRNIRQHFVVGLRRWSATRRPSAAAVLAERVLGGRG